MEQAARDSAVKEETAEPTAEVRGVRADVEQVGQRVDEISSDIKQPRDDRR